MNTWQIWKSGFDRWEKVSAEYLDKSLQKPSLLGPSARALAVLMQAKIATRRLKDRGLRKLGITTNDERDRAMHRINQLESQLLDLREELQELRDWP